MGKRFEVLDDRTTPLGDLMLRRRMVSLLEDEDREVYEVILNGEFLMSSLFHVVEIALADLGLAATRKAFPNLHETSMDIVVGGLGLGYTAAAVLVHNEVRSLKVIDIMEPVIRWHKSGLVPLAPELSSDPRCRLVQADFFALAANPEQGFDLDEDASRFHAILLDIDHSPAHWLNPTHADLYKEEGLRTLAGHLHPGGVFAMWSDGEPDEEFLESLCLVFSDVRAEVVPFPNPVTGGKSSSTVYLAVL
jgi:spermidine synthase